MRLDYFKLGWNVFDFTIVVFSIVGELIVAREFFFIINLFLFGVILTLWKEVTTLSIHPCRFLCLPFKRLEPHFRDTYL